MSIFRNSLNRPKYEFPRLTNCPVIEEAVSETTATMQIDRSLAYACALAVISTGLQGLIKVKKPTGQVTPTSLMILVDALSGDGKTAGTVSFSKGIIEYQDKAMEIYKSELKKHKAAHSSWKTKYRVYKKKLARLEEADEYNPDDITYINSQIEKHVACEPMPPRKPKLIYEDATPEALFLGLYNDMPTAAVFTDEGGMALNGRTIGGNVEKYSSAWSGSTITFDRVSKGTIEISGKSLTVFLGIQPTARKKYMKNKGEYSRGSGLWARFLVCSPDSPQGRRQFTASEHSWRHRNRFADRLLEFLNRNSSLLKNPDMPKSVISFTIEAADLWLRVANHIESEINPGGRYEGAGDLASKLPDNIARVAALLHYFEKMPGDISAATLNSAIQICMHYADNFLEVFNPPPTVISDAAELDEWFDARLRRYTRYVQRIYVRRFCAYKLRERNRLDQALLHLQDNRKVGLLVHGRKDIIDLHPTMPHDLNRMAYEIGISNPAHRVGTGLTF